MPFDIVEFGRRLRAAREQDKLTQEELAARIRANRSWISGLETGQQTALRAETVVRCAEALGVSADYLLGLTERCHPRPRRRRQPPTSADGEQEAAFCAECGVGDGAHLIDCSVSVARIAHDPQAAAALERGRRLTAKLRELAGKEE